MAASTGGLEVENAPTEDAFVEQLRAALGEGSMPAERGRPKSRTPAPEQRAPAPGTATDPAHTAPSRTLAALERKLERRIARLDQVTAELKRSGDVHRAVRGLSELLADDRGAHEDDEGSIDLRP